MWKVQDEFILLNLVYARLDWATKVIIHFLDICGIKHDSFHYEYAFIVLSSQ